MIDFLITLALNLRPKAQHNSSQEASKIEKKRHRTYDAIWLGIWAPLGTILDGFWRQAGSQVGTKSFQKSIPKVIKKTITFSMASGWIFD